MRLRPLLLPVLALPLLAGQAAADVIYLVNGKSITDVTITNDGLLKVEYKEGNDRGEVKSDDVLSIDFEKLPSQVDVAETRLDDDAYFDAIADLEEYVEGALTKEQKRFPWAPAYAMFRLIELNGTVGQLEQAVKAANKLIQNAPESRYLPYAYMMKAEALADLDKGDDAKALLEAFGGVIDAKQLTERWRVQKDLFQILLDTSVTGKARRDKLQSIITRASSDYPVVANRARAAVGEALVEEKKLDEAEQVFRDIIEDPKADNRTLAAAYTGLGDCLFQKGANQNTSGEDGTETLREALKAYLRVVVVYAEELRYVPKAMFFAGRVFQQWNDAENQGRAQQLYTAVLRDFGSTRWANEAKGFRR